MEEIKALLEETMQPAYSAKQQYGSVEEDGVSSNNGTNHSMMTPDGTLLTYPELARRAFGKYSSFISYGIAAMQFGVCLTYLIFVPQNLVECTRVITGGINVPFYVFLIAMVMIEIPLSWIRDIRKLTPTNVLATLLIVYGLVSCLAIALFWRGDQESSVTLIVPLQEAVFTKEDKKRFPSVNVR
eukprot:6096149-Ditylum_brightwellii.AAC.1